MQNAHPESLTVKNIDYNIVLENGVDLCGQINRTYTFPLGVSDVEVPINLSLWEAIRMFTRQTFGEPIIHYKLNATAQARTSNPKLSNVYIIFEDHSFTNLKEKEAVAGF